MTDIRVAEVVRAGDRFEARAADGTVLGATYYDVVDGAVAFTHTEVPPPYEGKGVASALVQGALDQVRAEGSPVVALCPYVNAWMLRHPQYTSLLRRR